MKTQVFARQQLLSGPRRDAHLMRPDWPAQPLRITANMLIGAAKVATSLEEFDISQLGLATVTSDSQQLAEDAIDSTGRLSLPSGASWSATFTGTNQAELVADFSLLSNITSWYSLELLGDSSASTAQFTMTARQASPATDIDHAVRFAQSLSSIHGGDALENAIVRVYSTIDDLLDAGLVGACDSVLRSVNVSQTDTDLLLAFLMATAPIPKNEIPFRDEFYRETFQRFVAEVGPDEAQEILNKLQ